MTNKIDRDLSYARELIQGQQYDKARKLLQNINHPQAREWLAQLNQMPLPPKKKRGFLGLGIVGAIGAGVVACIGIVVCLVIAQTTGIIPRGYETKTAEARAKATTQAVAQAMTETIIALTPTATPTNTFTPSNTPTQTNTPTITPTPSATATASATFTASSTPTPSNTPLPTDTPRPTATRTMQEEIERLIKNTDDTGLSDSDVESVTANTDSIYLRYRLKEAVLSTGELRDQADRDYKLIACHLYDRGYRQTFSMTAMAKGTDAFGNEVWLEAVEVTVSPTNVARFNCDDVDAINLSVIASNYYVHPSIDD